MAQQRQILAAMAAHADSHDGYMPFVGLPHPNGLDPTSLEDSQMQRYDYYGTSANPHVMSVLGALAPILGQHIDATSEAAVSASVQTGLVRQLFHCPSNRDQETLAETVYDGAPEYGSYAFNEAALGWATSLVWDGSGLVSSPRPHSRLRAKVSRFVHPSQLFLFTDASPRSDGWLIYCDASSDLSLRDFFVTTSGPP
ncbi:MAG TPA: hypothetical protein VFE47_21020, partial [Tepidisphaeraceae bacterium]|nr:hypothetical protein [Tepidisphaeraceae bacterium]